MAALKLVDSSEVSFFSIDERVYYGHVERRFDSRSTFNYSEGALGKVSYRVLQTKEEMELTTSDETDGCGNDEPLVVDVEKQDKTKDPDDDLPNQNSFPENNECKVASEVLLHRKAQCFEGPFGFYQAHYKLILYSSFVRVYVLGGCWRRTDRTRRRPLISRKKMPEV